MEMISATRMPERVCMDLEDRGRKVEGAALVTHRDFKLWGF